MVRTVQRYRAVWIGRLQTLRWSAVSSASRDGARALSLLDRIDYADSFLMRVSTPHRWPAERWARLVLIEAPLQLRTRLVAGWSALGLKLSPGATSILGWTVRISTPDHILLGAESRVGMPAELLFKREMRGVRFCTFVAHENPLASAMWAVIEPIHGPVVLSLLRGACERSREDASESAVKHVAPSSAVMPGGDEVSADRK